MNNPAEDLAILTTKPNEMEAALLVNALESAGIKAVATGAFTSMFKAEAPGYVAIHVRQSDLEKARTLLGQFEPD